MIRSKCTGPTDIEVRHILSPISGLPGFQKPITVEDICDSPKLTSMLAAQAPWWDLGTASWYGLFTQGYMLAEIVHCATEKSLKQFIKEDIADFQNADIQLGCLEIDEARRSDAIPPPPPGPPHPGLDPNSIRMRVVQNAAMRAAFASSEAFRSAEIVAGNGHSNARGVNRILSVLSMHGHVDGREFMSPQTVDLIFRSSQIGWTTFSIRADPFAGAGVSV